LKRRSRRAQMIKTETANEAKARKLAAKDFHLEEWKSLREEIAANGS
jgi:hypothetical protein